MYGRWHAAEQVVDPDWQQKQECKTWFHRLNTDPRHRVAAGMGAEVIRKHQESLMASAWEQVGEIEKANDLLRRAQIGRETSNFLYERLGGLLIPQPSDSNNTKYMDSGLDTFLSLTRPVQKRLSTTQNSTDGSSTGTTIAQKLSNSKLSQLPAAALDPAFRRISRVRGPIRKRQPNPKPGLLRRLAEGDLSPAGPHPRPDGTLNVCDVTKAAVTFLSIKDVLVTAGCSSVYFEVNLTRTSPLEVTVEYETEDRSAKASEGHYSSKRGVLRFLPKETKKVIKIEISNDVSHFEVMKTFRVILSNPTLAVILDRTGEANIVPPPVSDGDGGTTVPGGGILVPEGDIGGSLADAVSNLGRLISFSSTVTPRETSRKEPLNYYRFCERNITCRTLNEVWSQADLSGNNHELTNQAETKNLVCQALDDWLNNIPAPEKLPQPREDFLDEIANEVIDALDPKKTILARTQQRLRWSKDVKHIGDPLDPIMAAPEFPQPMYEQLRDISQEWILPGVAKVPQNTIGLLKSNRRFIEAYMIGLNHEFARELLWRGYPTDQRGSYFRQFWDVSGYVPIDDEREDDGSITLKTQAAIREKLKDISYIHEWRQKDLGANDNRAAFDKGENLVLIVRGDLLKKYPNTLIYAIEGAANPKNALRTYFPIFSGTLPPDLTFLGFSFTQATALGDSDSPNSGIYFVIEERISETRFGLNEPSIENSLGSSYLTWAEITWAHFADDTNKPINYDQYLNGLEPISNPDTLDDNIPNWNGSSAAIAHITCQSPVRMILHAREMLFKKIDALLSPEFKSFWPPLGQPGINVLLFGRNFTVGKPTVKFGTYTAEIVNSTDTQILTRVPLEFDSDSSEAQEVTITVTNYYGTIEYPQPFKIPPSGRLPSAVKPVVSPEDPTSILQGTPGTTIYFQGSQFLEEVWFGTFSAQIRPKQGGGGSSGVYTLGYFVTIPEMLPGRVPISLQNEHGIVTLSETFSILTKSNYWYGFSAGIGGDLI
ncbi:MAG: Calx-beta domain-containing protein [Xenococcus sp. (in: cyanobacteria)]